MNSDGSEPRLENEWYPDRYGDRHDPPSAIFFNTMQDIEKTLESKEFKEKFWEWFDCLPEDRRRAFDYHRSDMAKIYFYNAVWRKK